MTSTPLHTPRASCAFCLEAETNRFASCNAAHTEDIEAALTDPQRAILSDVRESGTKTYNGRARRTIEALVAAGLVTSSYEVVLHGIGAATDRYTVTAV